MNLLAEEVAQALEVTLEAVREMFEEIWVEDLG